MKKATSIILMALVLVMGLTQCKKNNDINTADNEGEKVHITLQVNQGNGSRLDVDPPHVTFENGDVIYVASNGKYVGTLTHNGTTFEGEISSATEGQPLYFYLLGNVTPAETLTAGTTTTCSVNISDQTGDLPVIACAPSDQNFGATTVFTATLRNKCALVKFNVTTASSAVTCIMGFNNKVTVDFLSNTFTPSKEGTGIVTLSAGSGEKWAILLPQNAMEAGAAGSAYSADGVYTGTHGAVPVIPDNAYLTTGIDVTVTTKVVPTGAICGKFTINGNGDQVYFSQGNLQYQASTDTWKFAENQYDYVGSDNINIHESYSGWIDLFGWGTSGYHNSSDSHNLYYHPYSISTSQGNSDTYNYYGYGPSTNMTDPNLTGTSANYDWGVYNAISNGGNQTNQWRTLTYSEWNYVFNTRSTTSGIRYAKADVNNVNGLILLPDDWSSSTFSLSSTNTADADFSSNMLTASQWSILEQAGAVFLPSAGRRQGTSVDNVGSHGQYWSASNVAGNSRNAYYVHFYKITLTYGYGGRCFGHSVRLVCDVQ